MQRSLVLAEETADYSHIYRNFYDIFVGCFTDTKGFDVSFAVRETRNIYAGFVNLMVSDLILSNKHKFEKHPLEIGYKDYLLGTVPEQFGMLDVKLNGLESMAKNQDGSQAETTNKSII